jgi:2-haloacid dehalogenase
VDGALIFDLGGVVVDWSPRYLYDRLIDDPARRERFLGEVCSPAWHAQLDAGTPLREAVERRCAEFPDWSELIRAYADQWQDMFAGTIPGAVELLDELHARGTRLFAITNWPADTFPAARERFPSLRLFADIVVSGREGLTKPGAEIFRLALRRFGVRAGECLFIDDNADNVAAAERLGLAATRFVDVPTLRAHPGVAAHLAERG